MLNLPILFDITILFSFLIYLSTQCLVLGRHLLSSGCLDENLSHESAIGLSFFVGLSIFILLIKIIGIFPGAFSTFSVGTILLFLLVLSTFLEFRSPKLGANLVFLVSEQGRNWLFWAGVCICLPILVWTLPNDDLNWSIVERHLGSGHPGRYFNFAIEFVTKEQIWPLKQHHAQSVFLALVMLMGFDTPFIVLSLFLGICLFFLSMVIAGFIGKFIPGDLVTRRLSLLIVLFGNSGLSVTHLLVVGTVNPIIFNGIADRVIGVAIALFWVGLIVDDDELNLSRTYYLVPLIVFSSLLYTSEQEALILITAVAALEFFKWIKHRSGNLTNVFLLSVALLLGLHLGGAFLPNWIWGNSLNGEIPIGTIRFEPGLMYQIGKGELFGVAMWHDFAVVSWLYKPLISETSSVLENIWYFETLIWESLRIFFLPLTGIALLSWQIQKTREHAPKETRLRNITLVIFVIGYLVAFLFSPNEAAKWDSTRFLIFPIVLGSICAVRAISLFERRKIILTAMVCVFVVPVVNRFLLSAIYNVIHVNDWHVLLSRLQGPL